MSGERELIWVSKELAAKHKQLDSVEEQERLVKKIIADKGLDLEREQEFLDESLLQFKSVCLAHRKALAGVYQEQADILDTLWEDMGDVSTQITQHVEKLTSKILPLKRQVAELKKEIGGLTVYVPERLAKLAADVGQMDDDTKSLLLDLLQLESDKAAKKETSEYILEVEADDDEQAKDKALEILSDKGKDRRSEYFSDMSSETEAYEMEPEEDEERDESWLMGTDDGNC